MNHTVPDFIYKIIKCLNPVRILGSGLEIRRYKYGEGLAECVVESLVNPEALRNVFNLSLGKSTTILEFVEVIWAEDQSWKATEVTRR